MQKRIVIVARFGDLVPGRPQTGVVIANLGNSVGGATIPCYCLHLVSQKSNNSFLVFIAEASAKGSAIFSQESHGDECARYSVANNTFTIIVIQMYTREIIIIRKSFDYQVCTKFYHAFFIIFVQREQTFLIRNMRAFIIIYYLLLVSSL